MDFTTKKILNNGRYILSIIFGFLSAITYFIIPYFNANVATKVVQHNFERKILSKFESSSSSVPSSPSATTKRRRRRSSKTKSESSTLAPPPVLSSSSRLTPLSPSSLLPPSLLPPTTTTRRTTTKTPSIFSSKFEPSTSTTPPPSSTTTTKRETTIKTPSTFSSIFESTSTPPLALPSLTTTTPTTTTTTRRSIFSVLFDPTPYSSPWMYSTSGDLIGSESGVFMASASDLEEFEPQYRNKKSKNHIVKKEKQPKNSKKEYPPPIPSWKHKMPRDVPWSLSRHAVDERLTLKEECMEYYEYLEATREDGRLVLKLIVVKNNVNTVYEDEVIRDEIINRREKKKRIQEERKKELEMINGGIGTKKRRGHY